MFSQIKLFMISILLRPCRQQERVLSLWYGKQPYTTDTVKSEKNRLHKKFDFTTITDRLTLARAVGPTPLIKPVILREKGRDLTLSHDKSPYTHRKIRKATWQHKKRHQKLRLNLTIADRLRTVSWSNNSHPTGVVKPVFKRSTFTFTATAVYSKGHIFKNL